MAPKPEASPSVDNNKSGLFSRLRDRLGKTRSALTQGLGFIGGTRPDEDALESLEDALLVADVGMEAATDIVDAIRRTPGDVAASVRQKMLEILEPCSRPLAIPATPRPFIIMVVGVNGVGKTTTIGKLTHRLRQQGHSVMLAAGDTFRAAAIEQLQTWGARNDVPVIAQHHGADAASVAHDAVQAAAARGTDVLIIDTAGRQHTHHNLMEELKKIKRVIGRQAEDAPHEVLMVLDAGTGQNALSQLQHFHDAVTVTGLCLTKLDGTAKGGVLLALAKKTGLPIRFIGVGEAPEDLRDFDADEFVDALLG
jgi:fused signal recognition particle receptor